MEYINQKDSRPISPHIGIYKPQVTSIFSIMHRISGIVNYLGLVVMIWWVVSISFMPGNPMDGFLWWFFSSVIGNLALIGWTFSLFFHMCTGIRHLVWDVGYGFSLRAVNISAVIILIVASLLTVSTWVVIFSITRG